MTAYKEKYFFSAVRFGRVPKREKAKINAAMHSSRLKNMETRVMAEMADDAKIIDTVVRAHFDTCDYTVEKIKPFIEKAQAEQNYTQCSGMVSSKIPSRIHTMVITPIFAPCHIRYWAGINGCVLV